MSFLPRSVHSLFSDIQSLWFTVLRHLTTHDQARKSLLEILTNCFLIFSSSLIWWLLAALYSPSPKVHKREKLSSVVRQNKTCNRLVIFIYKRTILHNKRTKQTKQYKRPKQTNRTKRSSVRHIALNWKAYSFELNLSKAYCSELNLSKAYSSELNWTDPQ